MAEKKIKWPSFVSPQGFAQYAWVTKPDDKFAKADKKPQYKITVAIEDNEENRAFIEKVLNDARAVAKTAGVKLTKKSKSPFILPEDTEPEDFEPDPENEGKTKYPPSFKDRIFFRCQSIFAPALIDSKKQTLENESIFPDDVVRVKFFAEGYEGLGSGITLKLSVVQLIKKNTARGTGGPNLSGFDDIDDEDAYVANKSDVDDDIPF